MAEPFDSMGGKKNFFTYGGNVGFNLEFGVENTEISPNSGNSVGFGVAQYQGKSAGFAGGFSGLSGSYFGSFVPSERSPGAEFMKVPNRDGGYHEIGLGYSRGIRIGGMWSQTNTTLR